MLIVLGVSVAPVWAEEAYSLTKSDFTKDTVSEAVTLSKAYTEDAFRAEISFATLKSNGSTAKVLIGFGKSGGYASENELPLRVDIDFTDKQITAVYLVYKGTVIAYVASPDEVPTKIVIEIVDGVMDCSELSVEDFGVGTGLEFSAIYTYITSANYDCWTGGGYVTVKVSDQVGYSWMWSTLTPALNLYLTAVVMIAVIGAIIGAFKRGIKL